MAGKRVATRQLDIYNLDNDEEPEQPEEFQRAPEEVIKNRVIKVAKRRMPIGSSNSMEADKKNLFNSFSFGKSSSETAKSFSFLKSVDKPEKRELQFDKPEEKNNFSKPEQKKNTDANNSEGNKSSLDQISTLDDSNEYYAKLKGLNESVTKWIKQHVDANPFLNLTPIFKDYERYLEEIENLKPNRTENKNKKEETFVLSDKTKSDLGSFSFSPSDKVTVVNNVQKTETITQTTPAKSSTVTGNNVGFSFGFPNAQSGASPTTATSSQAFSFGISNTLSTSSVSYGVPKSSASSGFSFTNSIPFTFANVKSVESTVTTNSSEQKGEEESYQPPENKFEPVIEEGHVYSVRCKVFVKKENSYTDRGVGNLYLKPVEGSEKTQLVVRADTSLGNVLLNFILSDNIPFQRMGKKDVMGVVLPTPDAAPPPVPILLRVKSPEEADNLLKQLEKFKK